MITRGWAFKVHGEAKPKGSKVCRRDPNHTLRETVDNKEWRDRVCQVAHRVVLEAADPQQPVEVEITFTLPRPPSHMGTGKNRHKVKPSSPVFPSLHGTGDEDKLRRLVLDALQDVGVLSDDAQVIRGWTEKHYDSQHPEEPPYIRTVDVLDRPGAVVRIRPIG